MVRMRTLAPAHAHTRTCAHRTNRCVGGARSRRRPPAMSVELKLGPGASPVSLENPVPAVPASGEDEATESAEVMAWILIGAK